MIMRQLLSSVEFSLSPDTAVSAMVSVRNEVQERSLACRKIDDEEEQVAKRRKTFKYHQHAKATGALRAKTRRAYLASPMPVLRMERDTCMNRV